MTDWVKPTIGPDDYRTPIRADPTIVAWLVEIGYPIDFFTTPPIPEPYRWALARHCAQEDPSMNVEEWLWHLADEGKW